MKTKGSLILIVFGFLTLLLSSFIDNIRGPLLVPMVRDLQFELSSAGFFLGLGHLGAILASLFMIKAQRVYTDRVVLILSFFISTVIGVLGFFLPGRAAFWLLAVGSGVSLTMLGIMCNILVVTGSPRAILGKVLSGLHAMYGVGSFLGAVLVGVILERSANWTYGFLFAGIFAGILLVVALTFYPKYQKEAHQNYNETGKFRPAHLIVISAFAVYVGAEISLSMWMSPYLTEVKGLKGPEAAFYVSLYFLIMSGSRILCALFSKPQNEGLLATASLGLSICVFFYAYFFDFRFFPFCGFLGPFYPLLYSMMSKTFSKSWRLLASLVIMGVQIFLAIVNMTMGEVAENIGVQTAYLMSPILTLGALALLLVFLAQRKRISDS